MTKFAFETGSNITHKLAINRLADHTGEKKPGGGGYLGQWVCAAGLSEPPPHFSLFFGQL